MTVLLIVNQLPTFISACCVPNIDLWALPVSSPGTSQLPYNYSHHTDMETGHRRDIAGGWQSWALVPVRLVLESQRDNGMDSPFLSSTPSALPPQPTTCPIHPCHPPVSLRDSGPPPFPWGRRKDINGVPIPGVWFDPTCPSL